MKATITPRDWAVAAIDAFEHSLPVWRERELLDRLRDSKYAPQIDQIWSVIEKLRKTRTMTSPSSTMRSAPLETATTYWRLPDELRKQAQRDAKAKWAVRVLRDYFKDDQLAQSLNKAIDRSSGERFSGLKIEDDGTITSMPKWLRLSRECKTPAAQQVLFIVAMSETFRGFFGKPCDAAVAALTDVAFQTRKPTTIDQVRDAWRRTGQLTKK